LIYWFVYRYKITGATQIVMKIMISDECIKLNLIEGLKMTELDKLNDGINVSCEICQKEIPQSLAMVAEAEEYVRYYCGLECFEKREQQS